MIKKVKNTVPWTYTISDFNSEEIERETICYKVINYIINGKAMIILLIVGLIKRK